jgi:hypothetical protein
MSRSNEKRRHSKAKRDEAHLRLSGLLVTLSRRDENGTNAKMHQITKAASHTSLFWGVQELPLFGK